MNTDYNHIAIAALLHDIGKVGQRAFESGDGLSSSSKSMEGNLCPLNKEKTFRGYKHTLYTYEFCERIADTLPYGINRSDIANLASYHHNHGTDPAKTLIADADHLSSAMERDSEEDPNTYRRFRKILLTPILSQVSTKGENPANGNYKYLLKRFAADEVFPYKYENEIDQTADYHKLWTELLEKFSTLDIHDPLKYTNTILSLLDKYTWAVPSATNVETPDISLFDHLKTTSAIAGCLHIAENRDKPFILTAGDFGGIQNYIFNFSGSKGRAKTLRGRSFQVGVLSDQLAMGILDKLNLSLAHLIISAGGRFYLLLPNNSNTINALDNARAELHNWILEQKNGELRVNLAHIVLSKDDIKVFPNSLRKINKALDDASYLGFVQLSSEHNWDESQWLRPGFSGTSQEVCSACQKNMAEDSTSGPESRLCTACETDRNIGGAMVKNDFMEVSHDIELLNHKLHNSSFSFLENVSNSHPVSDLIIDFRGEIAEKYNRPLFTVLKNNYVPRDNYDNVIELSNIAGKSQGRNLLGILKADVDNLGYIFSRGLISDERRKDRNSISRFTTLSRSLEYFFSGYMYHLLKTEFNSIYTVFSGGDDMLLIGPWDKIHKFALTLYREFKRYTCDNNSWGISAGIGIIKPKTPVSAGNELAEQNLKISKNRDDKNSITTMGANMTWDNFGQSLDTAEQLHRWMQNDVINSSKVYRFLGYAERLKQFRETGNTSLLEVIPQIIYDLSRNWNDKSDEEKHAKHWARKFVNPEEESNRYLAFVCQYALYLNREEGNG